MVPKRFRLLLVVLLLAKFECLLELKKKNKRKRRIECAKALYTYTHTQNSMWCLKRARKKCRPLNLRVSLFIRFE